jgi:pyruvate formate lyase activating enzyme
MAAGIIFDIQRFAIHDGPGIRTTVFFKGCPLQCPWCHNPESLAPDEEIMLWADRCLGCGACLDACQNEALARLDGRTVRISGRCRVCGACCGVCPAQAREIVGRRVTVDEVMQEIEKDVIFYDESGGGATFSGGEPLMQPDFLDDLLRCCRRRGIHTVVDTSCYAETDVVRRIRENTDLFLCDLKIMDPESHLRLAGVGNELILKNIRYLADNGARLIIRVPVIPGATDGDDNVARLAEFAGSLPGVERVDLLPYHAGGADKAARLAHGGDGYAASAPSARSVAKIAELLTTQGLRVTIGG